MRENLSLSLLGTAIRLKWENYIPIRSTQRECIYLPRLARRVLISHAPWFYGVADWWPAVQTSGPASCTRKCRWVGARKRVTGYWYIFCLDYKFLAAFVIYYAAWLIGPIITTIHDYVVCIYFYISVCFANWCLLHFRLASTHIITNFTNDQ